MTTQGRQRLSTLVESVLACEANERNALLDKASHGDPFLRQEIEKLMLSYLRVASLLDDAPTTPPPETPGTTLAAGQRIGPYRIQEEIGRGGMGTVYLAVRDDDQYQSRVAVKVIHPGRDDESVVRRFRQERQILARLEHPNIARLYDGGTTAEGRPYFVMEAIEGIPIDRYCDEHRLSVRRRLELFRQVCAAVEFAHQNLVVHRDIKPGNILVTQDGVLKLLDFGIAKLLDPEPFGTAAELTVSVLMPMTPHYASPEQITDGTITTASDIYSLGLVLYSLLTGRLPYRFGSGNLVRLVSRMLNERTPPPSTAIVRDEQDDEKTTLEEISRRRSVQPQQLRRQLAGDLDNIVLMALRKEPQRRYRSVEQLSEDLRRHLEGLPVVARPATLGYRMGKYLRRHRIGVTAAATVLGLLIAFAVAMTFQVAETRRQRDIAEVERDKAEKVSDFLVDIFEVVDPGEARGNSITAREVLDRGARRVSQELADQPEVEATLQSAIGRVYDKLGLYEEAVPLLQQALETRRKLLGEGHLDIATSLSDLGLTYVDKGDYAPAEPLLLQVLQIRRRLLPSRHPDLVGALSNLAVLYSRSGRYEETEPLIQETLAILDGDPDPDPHRMAESLSDFAWIFYVQGEFGRAESLGERALAIQRQILTSDHPYLALTLYNLGSIYLGQGEAEQAGALLREAREIYRKILEPDHYFHVPPLMKLVQIHQDAGDYERSEQASREVLDLVEKKFSPESNYVAVATHNLAYVFFLQGDLERAEPLLRRAIEVYETTLGKDHPFLATSLHYLGKVRHYRGDAETAEELLERALFIRQSSLDGEHYHIAATQEALAELAADQGHHDEARDLYERALAIRERRREESPDNAQEQCRLAAVLVGLGHLHAELGETDRSRNLLERAAALTAPLSEGSKNVEILSTHTLALVALGRLDEARPTAEKLLALGYARPDFAAACRAAGLTAGR